MSLWTSKLHVPDDREHTTFVNAVKAAAVIVLSDHLICHGDIYHWIKFILDNCTAGCIVLTMQAELYLHAEWSEEWDVVWTAGGSRSWVPSGSMTRKPANPMLTKKEIDIRDIISMKYGNGNEPDNSWL
eukprot:TRINITY_DN10014_c0_g1_i1.p1 TRINITY_DN10014_c0_g1~~TRINITY_DN10014_c0_g1_i1.p1  ORF type:complete len:129 (-),score=36.98 TRINITY_DN10014_c0_g1_i1:177-563(-)